MLILSLNYRVWRQLLYLFFVVTYQLFPGVRILIFSAKNLSDTQIFERNFMVPNSKGADGRYLSTRRSLFASFSHWTQDPILANWNTEHQILMT